MSVPVCSEPGCESKLSARGLCNKHYKRWRASLTPEEWEATKKPPLTPEERKARRAASFRKYRERHPERVRETQKRWRAKNPLYFARYSYEHRDELNAKTRKRRRENPALRAKRAESYDRWLARNRQVVRWRVLKWQRENPEKVRARNARRRERKRGAAISDFTARQWREVLEEHGHRCYYCGTTDAKLQMEHRVPLARGGNHTKDNIVPACGPCNSKKGKLTDEEFLARR